MNTKTDSLFDIVESVLLAVSLVFYANLKAHLLALSRVDEVNALVVNLF